ncbi:GNAT family N-acetyltransferase [Paenibacillus ihbetae]|uniref:GNAT family N-acetyltransferase n=1 Tax=Paenibacillus ihbetae TaxID=1870820 RepID=A0A1B2DUH9_9BACL|nr:GNAT family N-acetyltransferase [Paenibacillus ihbetae]ANY71364.1 GNAT family N-acetyltransferase [Paenibacillus ihbetae]
MKELPTIQLERLTLRPFDLKDAPVVKELAGDPYIAETTLYIPHPYEYGMAEEWIKTHAVNYHEGRSLELAIVHTVEQHIIGAICVGYNRKFDHGELAYWIGKAYKNNGYCTEAARGIISYAFEQLELNRVYARYLGKNPASGKVMEKLGMKYEGTLRQHVKKCGKYEDLIYYGLLKNEFYLETK